MSEDSTVSLKTAWQCGRVDTLCKLLYKRKLSELWLVHNPETHVEVCLNN